MPIYTIGTPDGRKIKIDAADEQTAIRGAQEWAASNPVQQQAPVSADGMAMPPSNLKPGTREYADWARSQAMAGNKLPQVSSPAIANMSANPDGTLAKGNAMVPAAQGMTFGWGDEIASLANAAGDAMQGQDFGQSYDRSMHHYQSLLDYERETNPIGSVAAEIGGAILPAVVTGGASALPQGATMASRVGLGALAAGVQGGIYGAGASKPDQRAQGAITGGLTGAAVGAAIPVIGNAVSKFIQKAQQGRILDAAAKIAPTADDLKSAASSMFEQATGGTPLAISDNAYIRFLGGVQSVGKKLRINSNLDQKSVGLSEMMMSIADDLAQGGTVVDMKDLHLLRQAAQRVAMSSEGRDAAFANTVIGQLDDFVRTLKPADILGGADPSQATKALFDGISVWSRANKVSLIEEAIRIGQSAASGPEKGIRNALRRMLLNKPEVWRRFSTAEQQAIQDVIDGTAVSNIMKLIGTFGFGGNTATNGIGGAAGMALGQMAGGPIGMLAGPVIGSIGRNASEKMTENLARRAMGAVATQGLKVLPPVNPNQATMLEQVLRKTITPGIGGLVAPR